ncbi:P-type conjugative transfer protein TrbL [Prosthecochloris vibrioformis]|uniref:P-type conjugative transfer protein TrbL n=1 Tax=Prosthecochloris vibrioformis TaxID=1098 RepID=A0A5C4S3F4_PROVB|nr:P-type conjugative transfer protein TrbL [Prosthecochloris vibrioformis]TNJ38026.1 P-type conjugative transfer protein TrbL [Prosthecochloris vibrioformis]
METGVLTEALGVFVDAFGAGWSNLLPSINWLIGVLLSIELIFLGLWWALSGGEQLASIMKKLLFLGFWMWIVTSFPDLADSFIKSLIRAGKIAGGGETLGPSLFDPSNLLDYGLKITAPLLLKIISVGITQIVLGLVYALSYIAIMLSFVILAWQVFFAILEYYLIVSVVGILLPFGFIEHTKFLSEKAIGAVVSSGVKLMVLSFIIAVVEPILQSISFSDNISLQEIWSVLLVSGAIAYLAWNAPNVASGLLSGSPSLSAQSAAQMGGQAAGMAAMAAGTIASGGVAATGAAAGAAGSAVKMASAVKTGAEIASSTAVMSGSGGLGSAVAGMKGGAMAAGKGAWNRTGGKVADFVKEQHKQGMAEGFRNTGGSFHKAPGWAADTMNSLQHGKEGEQSSS